MKTINLNLNINTKPKYLIDITYEISRQVENAKIKNGLCSLFIQHTSASLIIQENAFLLLENLPISQKFVLLELPEYYYK